MGKNMEVWYLVHLTSQSRMPGSRWVVTPLWLSGSWRSFWYSSSVYSCYLFLISSVFVRSIPFLSFIVPIFAGNVPLVSLIFLKRSLVFPILLFPSNFSHWSLRKGFLPLLAILWNSAFKWVYLSFSALLFASLFSQLFVRPCQTTILLFCLSFSWGWFWSLPPIQYHDVLLYRHPQPLSGPGSSRLTPVLLVWTTPPTACAIQDENWKKERKTSGKL